jgi:hypothetical protein
VAVPGVRGHLQYEVHLCSIYRASVDFTFLQGADGSRQPSELELQIAETQGRSFWEHLSRVNFE